MTLALASSYLASMDAANLPLGIMIAYGTPFVAISLAVFAIAKLPTRRSASPGHEAREEAKGAMIDEAEISGLCTRLRETDVFEGLTDHELRLIASIGERRNVRSGERLAHAGSRGVDVFTIFDGQLRLLTRRADEEATVRVAGVNETVPLAAILEPPLLVTTIEAATDGEVFAIPRSRFVDLCELQPMIGFHVYRAAAKVFEHRYRKTLDDLATSLKSVLELSGLGARVAH